MLSLSAGCLVKSCAKAVVVRGKYYCAFLGCVHKLVFFAQPYTSSYTGFYTSASVLFVSVCRAFMHSLHRTYYYNYKLKNITIDIGSTNFVNTQLLKQALRLPKEVL